MIGYVENLLEHVEPYMTSCKFMDLLHKLHTIFLLCVFTP